MMTTVAELLLARSDDDRPGLLFEDITWTWREVVAECARRAAWMRARSPEGGGRPAHVGVLFDNVPEMVFLLGGAALSGAVVVALNTTRSAAELAADATGTDCDVIVHDEAHAALAADVRASGWDGAVLSEDDLAAGLPGTAQAPPAAGVAEGDTLMLIFTSGTSGAPRAVVVTHRKVFVPGESLGGRLLSPEGAVYCAMPLFHSSAVMAAYAPALYAGAALVLRRRFSASGVLADVRRYGCTYLHYVGKALSYVLATPEEPDDADNPVQVAFGNEAAYLEQQAFGTRFGCFVIDGYGSTETAIALAPDPFGPPGALGKLADGVKILNPETGLECPPARFDADGLIVNGEEATGELVNTAGAGLFDGYYKDPTGGGEKLRDGMFWSGDFGYADAGGYVFFVGRSLDRLRVDGENFGAAQVERVLAGLPGAERLAVYGVPDATAGDQVMLALVGDFDPAAFAAYLGSRRDLGPKWLPRYVRVAKDLPATASNKILKRALAREGWRCSDPVWIRPGREAEYVPMTGEHRAALRAEFERSGRAGLLDMHDRNPLDRNPVTGLEGSG